MRDVWSANPPVVRVSPRAQGELRPGEALVFDWTHLAMCCAVAGEVSLRCTTTREAQSSPAFVPLRTEDGGPLVVAHRRVYPLLAGYRIAIDCRRRFGMRTFSSSLPADLGLRASFGRAPSPAADPGVDQPGTPPSASSRQTTGGPP